LIEVGAKVGAHLRHEHFQLAAVAARQELFAPVVVVLE
jgi:hypothetical protein